MNSASNSLFRSFAEVASRIEEGKSPITIVNLNYMGENWDSTYKNERIPTARYIHVTDIGDKTEGLKNMLPNQNDFVNLIKKLNIGVNDDIVLYSDDVILGATRGYWMFKSYGFNNVSLLEGLFPRWKAEGHPVETGETKWHQLKIERSDKDFEVIYNPEHGISLGEVQELVKEKKLGDEYVLLDARDKATHDAGHIPGAKNIFFKEYLTENGSFKSKEDMLKVFEKHGVDFSKKIRTSCQTGMSATTSYMAAMIAGAKDIRNYDGSFSQWSKYSENPIGKN